MESSNHLMKRAMETVDTYDLPSMSTHEVIMTRWALKKLIMREPSKNKKARSFKVHVNTQGHPVYWTKNTV